MRRQLPALIEGGFVERSVNVLAFGLPGRGKTHFLAALGRELILRHSIILEFDGISQRAKKAGENARKPASG